MRGTCTRGLERGSDCVYLSKGKRNKSVQTRGISLLGVVYEGIILDRMSDHR